jgi:hypothetical protein
MIDRAEHPLTFGCVERALHSVGIRILTRKMSAHELEDVHVRAIERVLEYQVEQEVDLDSEVDLWLESRACMIALHPAIMGVEMGRDTRCDLGYLMYAALQGDA